jgi:hypothetical protein
MAVSLIASRAPRGLALSRRGFIVSCVNLTTAVGLTARGSPSTETQQHLCGDLFAFTAPDRPEVVFAVTLPAQRGVGRKCIGLKPTFGLALAGPPLSLRALSRQSGFESNDAHRNNSVAAKPSAVRTACSVAISSMSLRMSRPAIADQQTLAWCWSA